MLVERDEVADDAVVELEGALVFGERLGIGVELGDDVVAVFAGPMDTRAGGGPSGRS